MGKQAARWWEAGMEKRTANRCQAEISGERIAADAAKVIDPAGSI